MASNFFYQIKGVLGKNREGSFATQAARGKILSLVDKQLKEEGFNNLELKGFKTKHVNVLITRWKSEELSASTIKNRMCQLRWLSNKIGKAGLIPNSNVSLGIPSRTHVTNTDLSKTLDQVHLDELSNENIKVSLQLQAAFGLRREECLKFNPEIAMHDDFIRLSPSWCKGKRGRDIPIKTDEQRALLDVAKAMSKGGSMIPANLSYVQQQKKYEYQCIKIGLSKAHGLRHTYAQKRYQELTNMPCRVQGGLRIKEMTGQQKETDKYARSIITKELGHGRLEVTSIYLGGLS